MVCYVIRAFHGKATLNLLIAYSAFVCVSQCILAILIDRFSAFRALVDTYISQGQEFFRKWEDCMVSVRHWILPV